MRTVSVLGATGSVGDSTFKVLEELPDTHRVVSMVAHSNDARLVELARRFRPELVGLVDRAAAGRAREALAPSGIEVIEGDDVAVEALRATSPDLVLAAITGAAGLASSLETVARGASLLLANKEALVMAGNLITRAAAASGSAIVPVDSEHSAIFQAIHGEDARAVRRIFLTASGGPFVDREAGSFADVRPEDALRHPTWEMGRKITIDSATMMNKALEIVEARWLFDVPAESIEVLVHRQSIVHSMVEFVDGSILAQLGTPSMTVPVRHALGYPERVETSRSYFDIEQFAALSFEPPDAVRFPALDLGHAVARTLGLSGTALNAANEVAVAAFLDGATRFDRISETAARVLDALDDVADPDLEQILAADAWAREEATRCLSR
ncbi:MAG: 1-deoxy-D-xylulose-5-phosphate reductoisomerase [Planctomycetota bacterium JB042]